MQHTIGAPRMAHQSGGGAGRAEIQAPRPRRVAVRNATAPRWRIGREMVVRLSRQQRAWLEYLLETETCGWRSAGGFVRSTIQGFIESEGSLCLDPTLSPFRAWLLKRQGRTSRIRCTKGARCRPCARELAKIEAYFAGRAAAQKAVA